MVSSRSALLVLFLLACDEEAPAADPCPEGTDLTWDNYAGGFLLTWCGACHGSSLEGELRYGAPEGLNFDTSEQAAHQADAIANAATGDAPRMPPSGGPTDEERAMLAEWLRCGSPDP